ncbi:MBL fold metallo-hydrolase [Cytobacillus spongiae]|uniref:MBL fold metallo-hydrolase n=1 Tax=Cytobacillus spongiae TaxID=2901381 RepID=UPI001F284E42|nr:MBL fold metallo-hydrolase [Cytobacillus spongiae]UII57683.1 MBL fold metallo-hydrolase [Cytobacillus spongiae]
MMINIQQYSHVVSVKSEASYLGFSMSVFQYLVDGMLIDTGAQSVRSNLIPFYEEQRVELVSITHDHEDHTGTAAWLQKHRQIPIYIHEHSVDDCLQEAGYPEYRKLLWGVREPFAARPYQKTIESRKETWEVIHTPGHEKNHVCLLNKHTGELFSGDLYVSAKPKIIMRDESIPVLISSLRKILTYDFQDMYCAHSGYHPDGKDKFKRKLAVLEELTGTVKELFQLGMTVDEIDQQLFPKKPLLIQYSNSEFDSKHIIRSILTE